MKRPLRILAALGLVGAMGACDDDSTRPGVEPSTITVRAYVDANGSGVYDAGDTALDGTTITLTHSDGTGEDRTTDDNGVALFANVAPGSYSVSFDGAAPVGAVLATASNPVVAAPSYGADLSTEFRYVLNPGTVSGTLFRDENEDGEYDAGDTPAAGIPVAIYAGSTATGDAVAETATDEDGAFMFDALRPGTYTLSFSPFPTMTLAGGNTQVVTVEAQGQTTAAVTFTGSLLSTIAEARAAAAAGETDNVAVEGVVTWQPSFSDELFIEDETAGILVFAGAVDVRTLGLERGDVVRIVGQTSVRFGELQLTNVSVLTVESSGDEPEPAAISAVALNAGEHQHELIMITNATVTDVEVLSFDNQFVTLMDPAGNEFGVYADSRTGVEPDSWTVGGIYDVAGVPGYDNRFAFANRIEVRGPADVRPGAAPLTIAAARAAAAGTTVTVAGVVSWQPVGPTGSSFSDELFIQDETAGIQIYGRDADIRGLGLMPGDLVLVTGTTEDRFGERQLTGTTAIVSLASQAPPTPVATTPAELAAGANIHELVRVADATVVDVAVLSFGNHLVTLSVGGAEFGVYVDSRIGVSDSDWTVGDTVTVTGVVNYDSRYAPHNYRIWIRSAEDLQAGS